jgi:hypothetical protein
MYFSLYCKDINTVDYYSQLYYALQTLEKYKPFDFDVVVFYSFPNFEMSSYMHLEKYNFLIDFPWVKFYPSTFTKYSNDTQTHKWYNLKDVFELGYEQVFYIDCDVIFSKDPSYIFDKYPKRTGIYHMKEGLDTLVAKILGQAGAASGQWIIDDNTFRMTNNLFECIVNKRIELREKAQRLLDKKDYNWYCTLDEQYAGQMALVDQGIPSLTFYPTEVNWHCVFDVKIKGNDIEFVDLGKTTILHYLGTNSHLAVPKYLRTPAMIEKIKQYTKDNTWN